MPASNYTRELYDKKIYGNSGNPDVLKQVPRDAKTVLDVGCGAGDNAKILKGINKEVTCVTISGDEAKLVEKICDDVIIANIETDELKINKTFDVIILSHVCEHLVHPGVAINKLSLYLNENGIIIIAVPNMAYYKNRFKLLKGDWTMFETGPFDKTHLHFYSYYSASRLCDESKITIAKKIPGSLALPLWPFRRVLSAFCSKLDNSVGQYFPNLFAQQVVLVLQTNKSVTC